MPRFNSIKPSSPAQKSRPEPLPKDAIPAPQSVSHHPSLQENEKHNGFELHFPTRPDDACLAALRATKALAPEFQWHYHGGRKIWYARRNDYNRKFADQLVAGNPPQPENKIVPVDFATPQPATVPIASAPQVVPAQAVPAWRARLSR